MNQTPIIDVHSHLGVYPAFYFPCWKWTDVLKHMDICGVNIIIQAHQALLFSDWERGEKDSKDAYDGSNKRILSYTYFNPNAVDNAERVREHLAQPHYVGIKIHPSNHDIYADDESYRGAWEAARQFSVPILTHSYDKSAPRITHKFSWVPLFEKWVREFPDVSLILGHSGGLPLGHRAAVALAKRYDNVYLDMAGDTISYGFIEFVINNIGSERFMYASDLTWIDSRAHLGRIIAADIDAQAKEKILGGNAAKLFGLNLEPSQ